MSIVTSVLALLGTIFTGIMAYLMAKLDKKAGQAAAQGLLNTEAIEQNTILTQGRLSKIESTGEKIHKLTNSAMEEQLKLVADLYREKAVDKRERAEETKALADIKIAEEAEKKAVQAEEKHRKHVEAGIEAGARRPDDRSEPFVPPVINVKVQMPVK